MPTINIPQKFSSFSSIRVCALACVFTVVLAGCGGGGGGSSGSSGSSGLASTLSGNIQGGAAARTQAQTASAATPKEGSVTQSSNVDGSNVTLDQVDATATYSNGRLIVSVANQRSGSWGTISSNDIRLRSNTLQGTNTGDSYEQRTLGKRVGSNGVAIVDVFTNRLSAANTDYLVGGVWLYFPDDSTTSGVEIGAFVDSPTTPTPTSYLTTSSSASYDGDATGLYVGRDDGGEFVGEFVGDVRLNATFGNSPSISGSVTNFADIDVTRTIVAPIDGNPTLTMAAATISQTNGGFFTGDTTGRHTVDRQVRNYSGKWGGQFYGPTANAVGGTFGASTRNTNYDLTFIGAFGATRE